MMISRYNMRIKNNDKTYFRAVCIVLFSLAFTGCTKDGLNEFGPGNATGKVVMVSLNVSLPPIEEPTSTFMMNGALTIGTLDGANVEMHQQLGDENIFLFGLTAGQVQDLKSRGYCPMDYYNGNGALRRVMDQISAGFSDQVDYSDLTARLLRGAGGSPADEYLLLADFDSYCQAHRRALETYADRKRWNQMSLINIARSGIFAADRSIRDYARDIWHVPARP